MNKNININGHVICKKNEPYVIAEMSGNHNGNIQNAFKIIEMAHRCGVNAVKMQTYTPQTITLNSRKQDFLITDGLWKGKTLYELYDWAHTPWEWHPELFDFAKRIGITIFSTPFDNTAVDFLEKLNVPAYKIASFECTDLNLIKYVASTMKPLIISTGMANDCEIKEALETALRHGSGEVALLHCVSGYPAPAEDYNLFTIRDMIERFSVPIGISDHTLDNTTSITSIALGASIIEKHVTLNRAGGGPDDSFSLEEDDLKNLCKASKIAWKSLGKVNYKQVKSEKNNTQFRRSLYFVNSLSAGQIVTNQDIRSVRPGYGLAPKYFDSVIGRKVLVDIDKNSPVTLDVFNKK